MCKRWRRQLALLLTGLGRVAALLALFNLIPANSFAWDETPTGHLTLARTDEYTHALSGEPITFTFLLTTTERDTVTLSLASSPQLTPVTFQGATLTLPATQSISPGVSLTTTVASPFPTPSPTASATPATPTTAPPIPQTPSPTEAAETGGGGLDIFIIAGLFGLLSVLVLALLLWRRPRRSKIKPTPKPPPLRPAPAVPYLQSLATTGGPHKFLLDKPDVLIGRDQDADLRIDETFDNWETVSRQHARIIRQGDQVIIQDNDSLNGIAVNGRRTRRNLLKQGWRLEIGGVAFVFHAGGPPSIPPTGGEVGGARSAQ